MGRKPLEVVASFRGVVSIFEVSDYAPLMEVDLFWSEYFNITFLPVVSAEDGIKLGRDIMTHMMTPV